MLDIRHLLHHAVLATLDHRSQISATDWPIAIHQPRHVIQACTATTTTDRFCNVGVFFSMLGTIDKIHTYFLSRLQQHFQQAHNQNGSTLMQDAFTIQAPPSMHREPMHAIRQLWPAIYGQFCRLKPASGIIELCSPCTTTSFNGTLKQQHSCNRPYRGTETLERNSAVFLAHAQWQELCFMIQNFVCLLRRAISSRIVPHHTVPVSNNNRCFASLPVCKDFGP
jgi:hypothetical protein